LPAAAAARRLPPRAARGRRPPPRPPPRRPPPRRAAGHPRGGRTAPRPPLRGDRLHRGQARPLRHPGEAGPDIHRHRRAGHSRPAARAYRAAVMASLRTGMEMALDPVAPSALTGAAGDRYDADRLLAGYRTARAQEALFDLRPGGSHGVGYDEFLDHDGAVRPAWTELADALAERGRAGLNQLRSVLHGLIDNDGITYTEVDPDRDGTTAGPEPRPWSLDALPVVVSAADWDVLEAGLVQRSRLL